MNALMIPPYIKMQRAGHRAALPAQLEEIFPANHVDDAHLNMQDRMLDLITRLNAALTPRDMHRHATLLVRCNGCRGRIIAWAFWAQGMPLLISMQRPGSKYVTLNVLHRDDVYTEPTAWCRSHEWHLPRSTLMAQMPGPGSKQSTWAIEH